MITAICPVCKKGLTIVTDKIRKEIKDKSFIVKTCGYCNHTYAIFESMENNEELITMEVFNNECNSSSG